MPCQLNCEVHRLNLELQVIKTDKIKTLTELYQVTKDLGRNNRHRRNEVSRIERKLMTTIAERLYIEDEISRGCPACRQTWITRNKIAPQMTEPKNPQTGAIFQRHVAVGVHTGLKNVTLRNDDVVRQGTWQTSRPLGVSTCSFLTSGWYYTFSIVIQFNLTCCRRIINSRFPGTVLNVLFVASVGAKYLTSKK